MHDKLMNDDWQNLVKINIHCFFHSLSTKFIIQKQSISLKRTFLR